MKKFEKAREGAKRGRERGKSCSYTVCTCVRQANNNNQFFYLFVIYRYDVGCDGFLDLTEMKIMMEKLGAPQTHIGLKGMIAEVDEDNDGKISFREFMLIYR